MTHAVSAALHKNPDEVSLTAIESGSVKFIFETSETSPDAIREAAKLLEYHIRELLDLAPNSQDSCIRLQIENVRRSGVQPFPRDRTTTIKPGESPNTDLQEHLTSKEHWVSPNGFLILRQLSAGAFGDQYVAFDREAKREVALKRLHPRHSHDRTAQRLFVRNAQIVANLQHPGILPMLKIAQDQASLPYYTTPLVRGSNLHVQMEIEREQAEDNESYAAGIRRSILRFADVCTTVSYVHSQGVLHLDIKPSNIIVGEFNQTYLVDWDCLRVFDSNKRSHVEQEDLDLEADDWTLGTVAFASPEQMTDRRVSIDPTADVFSLGATLYEMLTSHPPRHRGSRLTDPIESPRLFDRRIPVQLERICLKSLEIAPSRRYQTVEELRSEIERWLSGDSLTSRVLKRRLLTLRLAATCCIAALVAILFFFISRETQLTTTLAAVGSRLTTAESQLRAYKRPPTEPVALSTIRASDPILGAALTPEGSDLAIVTHNALLLDKGRVAIELARDYGFWGSVAISPSSLRAAVATREPGQPEFLSQSTVISIYQRTGRFSSFTVDERVHQIEFCNDEQLVVASTSGVTIFDLEGDAKSKLSTRPRNFAISPIETSLAVTTIDGRTLSWNWSTSTVREFDAGSNRRHEAVVAYSHDGSSFCTSDMKGALHVFLVARNDHRQLPGCYGIVGGAFLSNRHLVVVDYECRVYLWDLESLRLVQMTSPKTLQRVVDVARNGMQIATIDSEENERIITIWSFQDFANGFL
ncbi:serine/threonine-protein kinase [Stieleria neptunia]|uniref:serine/threonine-protein kinase n=1 Tax=Stieleria neptunia TaxID=2527979 RepID=UPI001E3687DD|nr:serine/threonine-protein kinase [Stieleria neptunia]